MPDGSCNKSFRRLLDGEVTFEELSSEFEDDVACYQRLRDETKKSVTSFDDLIDFHQVCIEQGPTEFVFYELKRNAARSLKNMMLGDSRVGRRIPITSAAELQRRIDAYQSLGVESVTSRAVVFTLLEHIFDDDGHADHASEILGQLLQSCPDTAETVNLLARARFVLVAESLRPELAAFDTQVEALFTEFVDPRPDDDRSAEELLVAADEESFSSPLKAELVCASLAREPSVDALQEFLYLSARDIVERYRHDSRTDPWRGELQLSVRQYNCLLNAFGDRLSSEREARVRSYLRIALGELRSGSRWRSQRDSNHLPEANFLAAAKHYLRASHEIQSVDLNRHLKYLSKAFRHQATGVQRLADDSKRGWLSNQEVHLAASKVVTEITGNHEEEAALTETAVGTIALHQFRGHEAAAMAAVERGDVEEIFDHVEEARSHLDAVPVFVETGLLDEAETLAFAFRQEEAGEFNSAHETYRDIESPKIDLQNRLHLVRIKRLISGEEYQQALNVAEEEFGGDSPVLSGVQLLAGTEMSAPSIRPPVMDDITGLDETVKWRFTMVTHLASKVDSPHDGFAPVIESLFQRL